LPSAKLFPQQLQAWHLQFDITTTSAPTLSTAPDKRSSSTF
jgi:hypothetical protein